MKDKISPLLCVFGSKKKKKEKKKEDKISIHYFYINK